MGKLGARAITCCTGSRIPAWSSAFPTSTRAKLELLRMRASQFEKTAEGFGVLPLGMNDYLFRLESRDRLFWFAD